MTTDATRAVPDTQEMVVIHRIFRRGFPMLAGLIRRVPPGDTVRAAPVATHLEFLLNSLEHHHTAEDEYLWPILLDRTAPDAELLDRMADQHKVVGGHIERARHLLPTWRAAPSGTELADTVDRLHGALGQHLDEEETGILPLVRAHVTAAEWRDLGDAAFAKFSNDDKLIALGQLLDVATPGEAATFLAKLPLPVRLVWRLSGRRRYARHIGAVRGSDQPSEGNRVR